MLRNRVLDRVLGAPMRTGGLVLEALPQAGTDPARRLARALKALLRQHGFRCKSARRLPEAPPQEKMR